MRFSLVLTLTAVLCSTVFTSTKAARILSIFPFPGPSQYIYGSALLKGLAAQGHEVTSISAYPQKTPVKNFRDVAVPENLNLTEEFTNNIDALHSKGFLEEINLLYEIGLKMCTNVMENAAVKKLLHEKFDLIIVEVLTTESLFGLAQHFNAPLIGVSTFGTIGFVDAVVGNTSPVSYVPHMMLPLTSKMSFLERLSNLGVNIFDFFHYNYWYLPQQAALYDHYFPNAKVPFDILRKNFSLVILNQHFSVSHARPYVPNMIEAGGLHIKQKPDPLPQDMQEFLDGATEGAIYFSMGSNLKSKDLPAEKLAVFLNTFRSLKMKVLWKFENTELPNKPSNVFISAWYPQPSILAHPNVKVFISHGGLLSTTEALFHAKPILGLPMFGDQPMNILSAEKSGYALGVDFKTLNEATLKEKLHEILNNPRYTQTVQTLSKRFRDQPMTPLETAVYWVEYVLRHDGAPHMRNAGQDLKFWQYHSLDTIGVLFGGFTAIVLLSIWLLAKCVCYAFGGKSDKKQKKFKIN